jgi:hypothetical protein
MFTVTSDSIIISKTLFVGIYMPSGFDRDNLDSHCCFSCESVMEIAGTRAIASIWHQRLYTIYGGVIFISYNQSIETSVHYLLE